MWLGYEVHTKHGRVPPPTTAIGCYIGHVMEQVNVRIHITLAVWQLATWCLIRWVGLPMRRRHCRGRNCCTRATVKFAIALAHILVVCRLKTLSLMSVWPNAKKRQTFPTIKFNGTEVQIYICTIKLYFVINFVSNTQTNLTPR